MMRLPTLLSSLLLMLLATDACAQQLRDGAFTAHYAAMSSTDLSPEIAARYGIRRGDGLGLLIVNTRQDNADGTSHAVLASAQGLVRDLLGDTQALKLRRVQIDGGDDLLAEFSFTPLQVLRFELTVQPQGAPRPLTVNFQQQFFGND